MTQKEQILAHLKEYGHITPMIALDAYGCFRLAARIDELRDEGALIKTVMVNRRGKRYAQYWLEVP